MGHIYSDFEIIGQKSRRKLKRIIVDTAATYTVVDAKILKEVGVSPIPGRIKIELGNGKKVFGKAFAGSMRIEKHKGPSIFITFPMAKNVIGVESLEKLGLSVNLKKRRLEKTRPAGLAYFY